jgi:hypothetical protein
MVAVTTASNSGVNEEGANSRKSHRRASPPLPYNGLDSCPLQYSMLDWARVKRAARLAFLILVTLTFFSTLALGQGGPPFRSDDPDTPGNKNWEINTVLIGERNPSQGDYEAPNIDLNYGLGNKIQLKYEVPLSIEESRGPAGHVGAGLGDSLLGIKWRFYAHHPKSEDKATTVKPESSFGISTYPQLLLSNPTSSVRRGIVDPGPQFLAPVEVNARIGPIRMSGEVGYWITNKHLSDSWIRGVIAGHEFKNKTELYLELFDQAATRGMGGNPRIRESTLGIGCRRKMTKDGSIWFLAMAGRSVVPVTPTNGQPSWIATLGLQFLSGRKRRTSVD